MSRTLVNPMKEDAPDARDGLTRRERVVLWLLGRLQTARGDRKVPLPLLHAHVIEYVDMSASELVEIVARLGARRSR